jgi:hypothetical protein
MPKDFVPDKDDRFHDWADILCDYISMMMPQWNIPFTVFADIDVSHIAFNLAYDLAKNPNHGKSDTHNKNTARADFEKKLREFLKEYITYNHLVTNSDRDKMGLPIHNNPKPKPSPIPITFPIMEFVTSVIRQIIIHFRDQNSKSKAKPFGVHGAEIRWAILDEPPVDVEDIVNSVFCTNSPQTLVFKEHERGKRVYLCIRWENTRGEKGPWSPIESVIIP